MDILIGGVGAGGVARAELNLRTTQQCHIHEIEQAIKLLKILIE